MGQERPRIEDKYPLYREDKNDRPNLEIVHDKHIARAITYSQTALSMLVLGATIGAFLYLILEGIITDWKRPVICLGVFLLFAILAAKRSYLSWRHLITAQFIEEVFGGIHTWKKYGLDEELKKFRAEKRYYIFLHKILKYIP